VLEIKPTMETREYATLMEKYIEFGFPIILENIGETIDNVFSPIIDKNITEEAGMKKIKWGDSDLQYHDDFKFYMTTKLPNPHYSPEICVKVTLINFTVTEKGLID
jgi:dynein heavy chain